MFAYKNERGLMRLECISKLNSSLFLLRLTMFWRHIIKLVDSLSLLFIINSTKYPHFLVLGNFHVFLIFYISSHYDLCLSVHSTFLLVHHNYWLNLHMIYNLPVLFTCNLYVSSMNSFFQAMGMPSLTLWLLSIKDITSINSNSFPFSLLCNACLANSCQITH